MGELLDALKAFHGADEGFKDSMLSARLARDALAGRYRFEMGTGWQKRGAHAWAPCHEKIVYEQARRYLVDKWLDAKKAHDRNQNEQTSVPLEAWGHAQAKSRITSITDLAAGVAGIAFTGEAVDLAASLLDTYSLDKIGGLDPLIGADILFSDSLAWMVGKPGSMKSFLALDMAGCVGTGETWQGYQVKQGPVLYLVAEGVRGTKNRVRAWEKAMGHAMSGVTFLPVAVQSKLAGAWDALVDLVARMIPTPVLVILDTQARITEGVEENSNKEMGCFVAQLEALRVASGACVLIVHHTGRAGEHGRGATTLDGAMSTIINVTKEDDQVRVACQKNKDGPEFDEITLRVVPMASSIVLMLDEAISRPAGGEDLRKRKWVAQWWRTHEGEAVSVKTLTDSGVVTSATFHRNKLDLLKQGLAVREGKGAATRYRLTSDPTAQGADGAAGAAGEAGLRSAGS